MNKSFFYELGLTDKEIETLEHYFSMCLTCELIKIGFKILRKLKGGCENEE